MTGPKIPDDDRFYHVGSGPEGEWYVDGVRVTPRSFSVKFQRWGFNIGKLHVCWWDMWERRPIWEVSWY